MIMHNQSNRRSLFSLAALLVLLLACSFLRMLPAEASSAEGSPRKKNYAVPGSDASQEEASSNASDSESESASKSIFWTNQETGYRVLLEDDAGLLTEEEIRLLALEMQDITAYGNVAFKSISYNIHSASSFARDYYHQQFSSESGTLFLIDMDNREIYIFSDGSVYRTITSAYASTITDNVYRYASSADYYSCASQAFEQIRILLSGRRIAQPMKYISNALLALILASLINYFVVRIMSRSKEPSTGEILGAASTRFSFTDPKRYLTRQTKIYHPPSSGGGSHGGGGGGHSGGGHSSGGGGGHRF